MRSGVMDDTSSSTGSGGPAKEKAYSVGCSISIESAAPSRFSMMRAYAVSSGELPNTCAGGGRAGRVGG